MLFVVLLLLLLLLRPSFFIARNDEDWGGSPRKHSPFQQRRLYLAARPVVVLRPAKHTLAGGKADPLGRPPGRALGLSLALRSPVLVMGWHSGAPLSPEARRLDLPHLGQHRSVAHLSLSSLREFTLSLSLSLEGG